MGPEILADPSLWSWLTRNTTGQVVLGVVENIVASILWALPSLVLLGKRLHAQQERHHAERLAQAERHHAERHASPKEEK